MFFAKGQEIATKIHFLGHIPLPDGLGTYQGVFGNIFDQSPQFPGLLGSGYTQITKEAHYGHFYAERGQKHPKNVIFGSFWVILGHILPFLTESGEKSVKYDQIWPIMTKNGSKCNFFGRFLLFLVRG